MSYHKAMQQVLFFTVLSLNFSFVSPAEAPFQSIQQQAATPNEPSKSNSTREPTWVDPANGLMWTSIDNGSDVDQPAAVSYCSTLQYAGYGGWRLPSVDELKGIYELKSTSRRKVVSNVEFDVHVKSAFDLTTGWIWSARTGDFPGRPYQNAWLFQFFDVPSYQDKGKPLSNFLHFRFHMRALCVRSLAPA